jgi:hypothetical protein
MLPVALPKYPTGQGLHAATSAVLLKVPIGHETGLLALLGQYWPGDEVQLAPIATGQDMEPVVEFV